MIFFAARTYFQKVGQICYFARGNLPVVHAQRGETVDGNEVEGRTHEAYAHFVAECFEPGVV